MTITDETSKKLAQIVLANADDDASARGPLTVRDRGENWLVVGPPVEGEAPEIIRRTFYMFVRKIGAEVTGIGYCFDFALDPDVEAAWARHATLSMKSAWDERPEVSPSEATLDLFGMLHGGIINRPDFAIAYAKVLLGKSDMRSETLHADERSGIWNVSAADKKLLSFSKRDGRIVA